MHSFSFGTSRVSTTEKRKQLMITTHEEDEQYLKDIISEIEVKRARGRPQIYTQEEAKERVRAYDRRRYYEDPEKKKC